MNPELIAKFEALFVKWDAIAASVEQYSPESKVPAAIWTLLDEMGEIVNANLPPGAAAVKARTIYRPEPLKSE